MRHMQVAAKNDEMEKAKQENEQLRQDTEKAYIKLLSHLIEGQKILGIGCIDNKLYQEIKGLNFEVYLVDKNGDGINRCIDSTNKNYKNIKNIPLIEGESRLAISDNSFDSIIIVENLPHIKEFRQLLQEAVRVVRNGGRIIISIPDDMLLPRKEHMTDFSKDDLIKELNQFTQEIDWHSLPLKPNWSICSFFAFKHDSETNERATIDIIMPTFNGRRSIRRAIKSLINQTYRNWNLIIVNDGGEEIKDIIDEIQDSRIKYIRSEHRGKSHALNIAIESSFGEYISYLDDDDILYPIHLEVLVESAVNNGWDFLYDDWYEVSMDENDKEIKREFAFRSDVTPSMLILKNYINHKCIIHKRSLLEKAGMYDVELEVLIDWDMIRRLSFVSKPHHIWCVTSEHIQYYKQGMMENKISSLWKRDPAKAKKSLERIIAKTAELPASEKELKESISESMSSFSYYHLSETGRMIQDLDGRTQEKAELESNRMIYDLRRQLQEAISHANMLNKEIEEMHDLRRQLRDAINHANTLNNEIEEMRRSIVWRTAMKFHNSVVEQLLPKNSKRRVWYDLGLKGLRIIANEGPDSFWLSLKNYIKGSRIIGDEIVSDLSEKEKLVIASKNFVPLEDLAKSKVAIVIHAYYVDLFKDICLYLENIPLKYTILISVTNEENKIKVADQLKNLQNVERSEIKIVENKGRDIAPLIIDFAQTINEFDYICHIHTKKSLRTGSDNLDWREYLYGMLLGSTERVHAILSAFRIDESIGLIYPETFCEVPYWGNTWLANKQIAMPLLGKLGVTFDPDAYLDFPAGSMFWARKEAIEPLLSLGLTREDFPEEKGQTDCTLHHTIERLFVSAANSRGLRHAIIKDSKENIFYYNSDKNIHHYFIASFDEKMRNGLQHANIVSFDIFDTILIRPFATPDMVFNYLEERIAKEFNIKGFRQKRKDSENIARSRKSITEDVDISEIYEVFAETYNTDALTAKRLLELEVNTEKCILAPRGDVITNAKMTKKLGKRLILVSDTYIERKYIEKILSEKNIEFFDELYLSCEIGKRKDRGDLWDYVLDSERATKESLLHVGDNEQSDIHVLTERGFLNPQPIHVMRSSTLFRQSEIGASIFKILKSHYGWREDLLYGMIANSFCSNPYPIEFFKSKKPLSDPFSLGYTVFGPIIFNFMSWLLKESRANGVENIKFIAREGFLLHKAFELIINHPLIKGQGIVFPQGSYFLCSRRASIFAALRTEEDISRLLERHFTGTIKSFFYNRLNVRDMDGIEHLLGAEILEREIILPDGRDFLFNVIVQVFDILARQAEDEREALLEYCAIQGLNGSEKIGLVDIGYSGSIQKALSSLLRKPLAGYYFVTDDIATPLKYPGSICRAYFGEFIDPANSSLPIHKHSLLLEAVLTAPSGQLLYFQRHNREIVPIFKEPGISQKEFEKINQIHEGILEFINSILNSFGLNALDIEFPKDSIQLVYDMVAEGDIDIGNLKNVLSVEDNFCGNKELCAIDFYKE